MVIWSFIKPVSPQIKCFLMFLLLVFQFAFTCDKFFGLYVLTEIIVICIIPLGNCMYPFANSCYLLVTENPSHPIAFQWSSLFQTHFLLICGIYGNAFHKALILRSYQTKKISVDINQPPLILTWSSFSKSEYIKHKAQIIYIYLWKVIILRYNLLR